MYKCWPSEMYSKEKHIHIYLFLDKLVKFFATSAAVSSLPMVFCTSQTAYTLVSVFTRYIIAEQSDHNSRQLFIFDCFFFHDSEGHPMIIRRKKIRIRPSHCVNSIRSVYVQRYASAYYNMVQINIQPRYLLTDTRPESGSNSNQENA